LQHIWGGMVLFRLKVCLRNCIEWQRKKATENISIKVGFPAGIPNGHCRLQVILSLPNTNKCGTVSSSLPNINQLDAAEYMTKTLTNELCFWLCTVCSRKICIYRHASTENSNTLLKNNCVLDITFYRQIFFFKFSLYPLIKINF
jgi:hypothetical protein